MNIILKSTLFTLNKAQSLLDTLTDDQLCNPSIGPYYSSIGSHLRHVLDFYDCLFNYGDNFVVDLTSRSRNKDVERQCCTARDYLNTTIEKIKNFNLNLDKEVSVIDDMGLGKVEINYTFSVLFAQANSHAIHHFAIINYIIEGLGFSLEDSDFGYNPTTPKNKTVNC